MPIDMLCEEIESQLAKRQPVLKFREDRTKNPSMDFAIKVLRVIDRTY